MNFIDAGRQKFLLRACVVVLALITPCYAANNNAVTVPTVAVLTANNFGQASEIDLQGYNAVNDLGGGVFMQGARTTANSGTIINDSAGNSFYRQTNAQPYNVAWFGAKCGGNQVTDGVSTNTSHTYTSASAHWTAAMVGWVAVVNKAATSGNQLVTTVSGFTNAGSITLTAAAGANGTAETISLYPDDTTAINAAITAAGAANAAWALPDGQTCGYANPGSSVIVSSAGPGLRLNGGRLWLGQTGTVSDAGVGLSFTSNNSGVRGPGIIDGLYQNNQGVAQFNTTAVGFTTVTSGNYVSGNVQINNTKGRALSAANVSNFAITDLAMLDCGDFSYQHSGSQGDMYGRSNCVQVENPTGTLTINGLTAYNAAQSGLLLSNFLGTPNNQTTITVNGCSFSGNGYFGLDIEQTVGPILVSNCGNIGNSVAPSGVTVMGGAVLRDIAHLTVVNFISTLTDASSFVVETDNNSTVDWSLKGVDLSGTSANHAAQLLVSFTWGGTPQRVTLEDVKTDNWTVYTSGVACSTTNPMQQLLEFHNFQVSQLYSGGPQTNFTPQGNASTMTYFLGTDSNLGTVTINSAGSNVKASLYDFRNVLMNGAPTFTGATASATYLTNVTANPYDSFTCP